MKKKSSIFLPVSLLTAILFLLGSCSTEKNTAMHRGWHNMNARYNGYFYSKENVKETLKKINKAIKDDYTKILPLYIYTDNTTAKNYYNDFDKTIKKSSTVIQRHAITEKRTKKEIPNACKWIDENYMLIGQAHFYKRDLFSALEAFEYVSKKYPNPDAKYGAMIWIIRTNNEIGSFSQTESIIDNIRTSADAPKDRIFQRDYAAASAEYYIKTGDHERAIRSLTKAITLTRNKQIKSRFIFVLAQLYEKQKDSKKASQYYGMVPGLHPRYDMVFQAQINRARLFDGTNSKAIKKQLNKMLKDDKNIEYQDQIYYALAEIAHKENDIPLALNYLGKSIRTSSANNTQRALSYLKRADIYFDRPDYKNAQANYDSTMTILPKDYPNYDLIDAKKKSLTALITNLNTIALEDSLQTLAKMSEPERNAVIDKMIAKMEEEEKKKEEERQNQLLLEQQDEDEDEPKRPNGISPTSVSKAWYFYNPSTVSFGINEFTKKWGSRKLEDNWRRKEKEVILASNTDNSSEEMTASDSLNSNGKPPKEAGKNKKDRSFYLKDVPLTNAAFEKSTAKIIDAYYNAGSIYKEQLSNNEKSNETFETLIKRYPENKYKLSSYYQLYRTYLAMNNKSKAEYYKNILLTDFPDSEYAKIIKTPDYAKEVMASRNQVERFYSETYQLYTDGKYSQALNNCKIADTLYAQNYLSPQFSFLKALCIGRTQSIKEFESALAQIIIKYPKEPVKIKAQEMLDMINKQKNAGTPVTGTTASKSDSVKTAEPKFIFKEEGDYFWVMIVTNGKGNIEEFKIKLSDKNDEAFSLLGLSTTSVFLDAGHQLVSVKTFAGKAKAMDYYNFMKEQRDLYSDLELGEYTSFIISAENYAIFYKEKNIDEYQQFFTQNFQ